MKKLIISTILALSVFSSAAALSWSGLIDNSSRLTSNHDFSTLLLDQSNGIYLSVSSKLNKSGSLRFAAEGLYKYKFNYNFDSKTNKFTNIVDLDLFKFSGDWKLAGGNLALNLGRFQYSDYSGVIFSQLSDGSYIAFDTLKTKASLYAGYTGLLNRLNVSMLDNENKDADFYALCPKYIPLAADFSYKALFGTNTLGLQGIAFIPLSDDNKMKAYGTLNLKGSFGTNGSYDIKATAGTEKFETLMLNGKLETYFYIGRKLMLNIGGEYASGEQGKLSPFTTITLRSIGTGLSGLTNGVIVPKLGFIYAAGNFYGNITERVILSMPDDDITLHGFDTSVNIVYNLLSDVQLGIDIGAYYCKEVKERSYYYANLKASLLF